MNTKVTPDSRTEYEKMLAHAVMDVACELRLVDILDLAVYIRTDKHANLRDLVASSSELFFQPGALNFTSGADVRGSWARPLTLSLDLEFKYEGVATQFTLMLDKATAAVHIHDVKFDDAVEHETEQLAQFSDALNRARISSPAYAS